MPFRRGSASARARTETGGGKPCDVARTGDSIRDATIKWVASNAVENDPGRFIGATRPANEATAGACATSYHSGETDKSQRPRKREDLCQTYPTGYYRVHTHTNRRSLSTVSKADSVIVPRETFIRLRSPFHSLSDSRFWDFPAYENDRHMFGDRWTLVANNAEIPIELGRLHSARESRVRSVGALGNFLGFFRPIWSTRIPTNPLDRLDRLDRWPVCSPAARLFSSIPLTHPYPRICFADIGRAFSTGVPCERGPRVLRSALCQKQFQS